MARSVKASPRFVRFSLEIGTQVTLHVLVEGLRALSAHDRCLLSTSNLPSKLFVHSQINVGLGRTHRFHTFPEETPFGGGGHEHAILHQLETLPCEPFRTISRA